VAIVNVLSAEITALDASQTVSTLVRRGVLLEDATAVVVTNGDSIASTYRLHRLPSNARLAQLLIVNGTISSAAADFGIYYSTAGGSAVIDADAIASAVAISSPNAAFLDITHEAAAGGALIASLRAPLWQWAGLASDPGGNLDIVMTLTAAATATAGLSSLCRYVAPPR